MPSPKTDWESEGAHDIARLPGQARSEPCRNPPPRDPSPLTGLLRSRGNAQYLQRNLHFVYTITDISALFTTSKCNTATRPACC